MLTKNLDTNLLVLGQEAQSASQNTLNLCDLLLLNSIPSPGSLLTYLITLIVASQSDYFGYSRN